VLAQGEKEKQAAFAAQLRKQARELLDENAADDAAVQQQIKGIEAEDKERVTKEAEELQQRCAHAALFFQYCDRQ
jgi:uncharacterized protein (UPF0147 family)